MARQRDPFFLFSALLAFAIGTILALSVPQEKLIETVYTIKDEQAGSVFQVKFAPSEEKAVHRLIASARPGSRDKVNLEDKEPYRILRVSEVRRLGPQAGAFLKGFGAVWLLYFFVQILIQDYIINAYRKDLGRIRKRSRKKPSSPRKRMDQDAKEK